jgi:YVTN family beta-propeller protein
MMLNRSSNPRTSWKTGFPGFLRAFTLSLLIAAFGFASLHAQTVGYVQGASSISVLGIPANTTVATIPAGPSQNLILAAQIIASPDGGRVYALYEGSAVLSPSVLVIDTATNTAITTITSVGVAPLGLAITPDGKTLYVADQLHAVFIIDTGTNAITGSIPITAGFPICLAVTPDGKTLYVGLEVSNDVVMVNTATNTVVGSTIPIGTGPFRMAVTPDGAQLYVAGSSRTVAIATATNTVTATIPFDGIDFRLAITPDGSQVYVSGLTGGTVGVISTATNTIIATIPAGSLPTGIAVTPDGSDVYVALRGNSTVSVIGANTNTVVTSGIAVASGPQDLVVFNSTTPFAAFTVTNFNINPQGFHEQADFTLGANSPAIDLVHQPLTLTIGSFSLTIPAGSFQQAGGNMHFVFSGTVNGLQVNVNLKGNGKGGTEFNYVANVQGVNLTGQPNPVTVGLKIGKNVGSTTVKF